jgi:hypothetical protein
MPVIETNEPVSKLMPRGDGCPVPTTPQLWRPCRRPDYLALRSTGTLPPNESRLRPATPGSSQPVIRHLFSLLELAALWLLLIHLH